MIHDEVWKLIADWPDYEISDLGRVRRLTDRTCAKAGTIIKAVPRSKRRSGGYLSVDLSRPGGKKTHTVHKLVAEAFLGQCPQGHEVNHINGNAHDNRSDNLEYVTSSQNQLHAYRVGLQDARGEYNGFSKLTDEAVIAIRSDRMSEEAAAAYFDVSVRTIRDVRSGRTWQHLLAHKKAPEVARIDILRACGTCHLKAA